MNPIDTVYYNEATNIRRTVESTLHDHPYLPQKENVKFPVPDPVKVKSENEIKIESTDAINSTIEVEIEAIDNDAHKTLLENQKLKLLLQQSIERIEFLEKRNQELEEEKANSLLPKELFKKIFGEDQIEFLRKGRVKKWSNETIQKALKLRFSAGTRGMDNFFFA